MGVEIVRGPITRAWLASLAAAQFGDLVKAALDVRRGIMAVGGELHADEEAVLIDDGSIQGDVWGINLYPGEAGASWIEFDSLINVRPSQGNRSRGVDDPGLQERIRAVVAALVTE